MKSKRNLNPVIHVAFVLLLLVLTGACSTSPAVAGKKTIAVKWRDTLFNWQTRIDYSDTSRYLIGGKLTTLSRENIDSIASSMDRAVIEGKSWPLVLGIYSYLLRHRDKIT